MKHHRSPTQSYPLHATLALRHPQSIPTLLSPLRSIANTPPHDVLDDFQSNAWVHASSYRPPLTGLGITCLWDASNGHILAPENTALQMQVDGDQGLLSLPAEARGYDIPPVDLPAPTVPYRGSQSVQNCHMVHYTQNPVSCPCEEPTGCLELGLDGDVDPEGSNIIGLIPDVNMYDKLRRSDLPHVGVNPLDTIRSASLHDITISYREPASPTRKDRYTDDILPTTDSNAKQSPSPRVIQDIMSILVQPGLEFSLLSRAPAQGSSPSQQAAVSVPIKPEPTNALDTEHQVLPASYNLEYLNAAHSSPILNAHLGIELSELISRAARFRNKHPERDIDRAWLSHFAGKLSNRGELLNDFRCYVNGCDQRNKRRDHILVHVGAHVGQRPFACPLCPLRFLRKNECKRHEASHSGFRPYSCDICGQSFVRQDLVKRHVKRTHGLRDENESQGYAKKRARLH